ncbi:MAG: transposase [Rhodoferax sp.]|nr:transposase [Rhodoferax sp.]
MARLARVSVPGHPYHVIQRGNNRQPIFGSDADREKMRSLLAENAIQFDVAIHAYVLMDNHFHLLVTPQLQDALPKMMQAVGRRYVRHFNDAHQRSGTLWEGRYKSALVQSERYLLACMVYLDLNPVRAGIVGRAQDYPWSSHAHYVGLRNDRLVTPHALVWELGNTPFARESRYGELVQAGISQDQYQALGQSVTSGWVLGDPRFVAGLQGRVQRRLTPSMPGRPVKKLPAPD